MDARRLTLIGRLCFGVIITASSASAYDPFNPNELVATFLSPPFGCEDAVAPPPPETAECEITRDPQGIDPEKIAAAAAASVAGLPKDQQPDARKRIEKLLGTSDPSSLLRLQVTLANDNTLMGLIESGDDFGYTHGFGTKLTQVDANGIAEKIELSSSLYTQNEGRDVVVKDGKRVFAKDYHQKFREISKLMVGSDTVLSGSPVYTRWEAGGGIINEKGYIPGLALWQQHHWHKLLQIYNFEQEESGKVTGFAAASGAVGTLIPVFSSKGICSCRGSIQGEAGVDINTFVEGSRVYVMVGGEIDLLKKKDGSANRHLVELYGQRKTSFNADGSVGSENTLGARVSPGGRFTTAADMTFLDGKRNRGFERYTNYEEKEPIMNIHLFYYLKKR